MSCKRSLVKTAVLSGLAFSLFGSTVFAGSAACLVDGQYQVTQFAKQNHVNWFVADSMMGVGGFLFAGGTLISALAGEQGAPGIPVTMTVQVIGGGLAAWGYNKANPTAESELAEQNIAPLLQHLVDLQDAGSTANLKEAQTLRTRVPSISKEQASQIVMNAASRVLSAAHCGVSAEQEIRVASLLEQFTQALNLELKNI